MPGTEIEVQALQGREALTTSSSSLVLVQDGKLIVDLPQGDYRLLERGDCLMLTAGLTVALQPVAGQVILIWHSPR